MAAEALDMLSARHSGRLSQWMPLALFTALACYRTTFVSTQTVSQTRSVAELLDDANLPWAKSSGKRCSVVDRVLMPGAAPGVVGVERSIGTGLGLGECKAFCAASERCSAVSLSHHPTQYDKPISFIDIYRYRCIEIGGGVIARGFKMLASLFGVSEERCQPGLELV